MTHIPTHTLTLTPPSTLKLTHPSGAISAKVMKPHISRHTDTYTLNHHNPIHVRHHSFRSTLAPLYHNIHSQPFIISPSSYTFTDNPHSHSHSHSHSLTLPLRFMHSTRASYTWFSKQPPNDKSKRKKTLHNEWSEIKGELSYYTSLVKSADRSKHETQVQLVKPTTEKNSPVLPPISIKTLNHQIVTLPDILISSSSSSLQPQQPPQLNGSNTTNNIIIDNTTHTRTHPVTIDAKKQLQMKQPTIQTNKITVLSFTTTSYAMQLTNEWRNAALSQSTHSTHTQLAALSMTPSLTQDDTCLSSMNNSSDVQFISIHMIDRWLIRRLFSNSIISNFKKIIPPSQHSLTGITVSSPDEFTDAIGSIRSLYYTDDIYESSDTRGYMNARSRMFGYVVVLDEAGRIRWMTIGKPANEEQKQYFIQLIQQLAKTKNMKILSHIHTTVTPQATTASKQKQKKQIISKT